MNIDTIKSKKMKNVLLILLLFSFFSCEKDSHDGLKVVTEINIESERDYLVADGVDHLNLKITDQDGDDVKVNLVYIYPNIIGYFEGEVKTKTHYPDSIELAVVYNAPNGLVLSKPLKIKTKPAVEKISSSVSLKNVTAININTAGEVFETNSWEQQSKVYETEDFSMLNITIWDVDSPKISLYQFPNDFNPNDPRYHSGSEEWVKYREQYNLLTIDLHEDYKLNYLAASREKAEALCKIIDKLIQVQPAKRYILKYTGHGHTNGMLASDEGLTSQDTRRVLSHFSCRIGKKIDVLDWNSNCSNASFENLWDQHFFSKYILASDLPRGGYEKSLEIMERYDTIKNYHNYFSADHSILEGCKMLLDDQRKMWEGPVARESMIAKDVEQEISIFDMDAFEEFNTSAKIYNMTYGDVYDYVKGDQKNEELFHKLLIYNVNNKDFFDWNQSTNGLWKNSFIEGVVIP